MPKAYVIANIDVHDPELNARYREQARPTVEMHGGRYIIRGPNIEKLEGDLDLNCLVVLEFASADAARKWYRSPEYQKVVKLRHDSAASHPILVEGFDDQISEPDKDHVDRIEYLTLVIVQIGNRLTEIPRGQRDDLGRQEEQMPIQYDKLWSHSRWRRNIRAHQRCDDS